MIVLQLRTESLFSLVIHVLLRRKLEVHWNIGYQSFENQEICQLNLKLKMALMKDILLIDKKITNEVSLANRDVHVLGFVWLLGFLIVLGMCARRY